MEVLSARGGTMYQMCGGGRGGAGRQSAGSDEVL